jgi:hypothetical protein
MNNVKTISKTLFYLTRMLAYLYIAMPTYSLIVLISGWNLLLFESDTKFKICFPFTQKPCLLGMYEWSYITFGFLIPLALYGLFFWLLSNFFKAFAAKKLFTAVNYSYLRWFYLANIFLPIITLIISSVFMDIENEVEMLVALHTLLGIFAYFIAAIFQQGISLQNEQDLYI